MATPIGVLLKMQFEIWTSLESIRRPVVYNPFAVFVIVRFERVTNGDEIVIAGLFGFVSILNRVVSGDDPMRVKGFETWNDCVKVPFWKIIVVFGWAESIISWILWWG